MGYGSRRQCRGATPDGAVKGKDELYMCGTLSWTAQTSIQEVAEIAKQARAHGQQAGARPP